MLLSIISSSLHPPYKPLHPFLHHPRTSKHPILITNLLSRRSIAAKSSVSDQREMTELARADVLGDSGSGEREAVLANGSVGIGRDVAWRKVESIINRMSKWLVAGLFGLVILWRHDAEAMWASMGSVVNSWLSITLKQMLNHQRPNSALRSDPGMPSSHAQSIFYAASYAVLSLVQWLGTDVFTLTVGTIILTTGSYLSWLRISQKLHTPNQVLVGAALGSVCGITWYRLWHSFVVTAFVSSLWVRVLVVLGSATFCAAFLIYVVRHWLMDDQDR